MDIIIIKMNDYLPSYKSYIKKINKLIIKTL